MRLMKSREVKREKSTQNLPFDPRDPPKREVYVGQKVPVFIVPDDTPNDVRLEQPGWKKADWHFEIVDIRQGTESGDVLDVKWPNDHIDKNIPVAQFYGVFSMVRESNEHLYTEEYVDHNPETDAKTQEIMNLLIDIARKNGILPSVDISETDEKPTPQIIERGHPQIQYNASSYTLDDIDNWFRQPAKGGLRITEIRKKARLMDLGNIDGIKKDDLKKLMIAKINKIQ